MIEFIKQAPEYYVVGLFYMLISGGVYAVPVFGLWFFATLWFMKSQFFHVVWAPLFLMVSSLFVILSYLVHGDYQNFKNPETPTFGGSGRSFPFSDSLDGTVLAMLGFATMLSPLLLFITLLIYGVRRKISRPTRTGDSIDKD